MSNGFKSLPAKPGRKEIGHLQASLPFKVEKQSEIEGIGMGVLNCDKNAIAYLTGNLGACSYPSLPVAGGASGNPAPGKAQVQKQNRGNRCRPQRCRRRGGADRSPNESQASDR